MREKLKGKLRSRRGATLLLSLLLFLICAVAGSVAITAGTASSGTVSERAKMDQRYFSVTSAAELLRKTFDGKYVRISGDEVSTNATGDAAEFLKAQSLYLLNERRVCTISGDNLDKAEKAGDWLTDPTKSEELYEVKASLNENELKATVEINRIQPERLEFIVRSAIERENDEGQPEPEKEIFALKIECAASIGPAENDPNGIQVNWKIGSIRLAN